MRQVIFDHGSLSDLSREILAHDCHFRFRAKGFSMYPFIRDGDVVTIRPVDPSFLNVGDVIFYQLERSLVVHRIIGKQTFDGKMCFTTRGDSSPGSEQEVYEDLVLGKVVTLQRNSRTFKVNHSLSHCLAKCWLIYYPIVPLAIRFILSVRRRIACFFR
jgi:signal peptidase I